MRIRFAAQTILVGSLFVILSGSSAMAGSDDGTCESVARRDVAPPKVEVFRVKEKAPESEGFYRVSGSVEGVCLSTAGYFEKAQLKQPIEIVTTRAFRKFEFELIVRLEDKPEIRAANVAGDSAVRPVKASRSEAEWQETYEDRYHGLRDR